jgi:CubicO group peptidase (beta-lactamase class C family)
MSAPISATRRLINASLSLVLLLAIVTSTSPAHADQFETIRNRLRKAVQEEKVPSLAVAVAKDRQIIWEEAFGWADLERQLPATPQTMYSLASISKPITATALMLLVQQGKVDLDQPANKYLGSVPLVARVGHADNATVRRVANHTAGLPLHYQFFYADESAVPPPFEETLRRYGNLYTIPGRRHHYSNLGYGVLEHIVSVVSGQPFAQFLHEQVCVPLDLPRMAVGVPEQFADQQALRYDHQRRPIPPYTFDHPGASAVYSSVHDLCRFGMFHLKDHLNDQKPILTDASIDAMQDPAQFGYGIGWGVGRNAQGYSLVSHTGGMPGVSSTLILVPAQDVCVTVLTNTGSSLPGGVADSILKILLPPREDPAPTDPHEKPDADPEPAQELTDLVGLWKGQIDTYHGPQSLELDIKPSGDVHVRLGKELWTLLNDARVQQGWLRGRFLGEIHTDDARRQPHYVHLELRLREGVLGGAAIAITKPAHRTAGAVSYWTALRPEKPK